MKTNAVAEIYLHSAEKALEEGNYEEAENYANKMLENVPQSYRAWFVKGEAAGWQTTGADNRFTESTADWINAYNFAPKNKKEGMRLQIQGAASKISAAILTMRCNHFKALRDENSKTGIMGSLSMIEEQFAAIREKTQADIYSAALKNTFAGILSTTAAEVGGAINTDFGKDSKARSKLGRNAKIHTKSSWEHLIISTDCCLTLLEKAYDLSTDEDLCFGICKSYIDLANLTKDSCSGRRTPKKYRYASGSDISGSSIKYGAEEILHWEKKMDMHDPEKRKDNLIRSLGYISSHGRSGEQTLTIYTQNKSMVSAKDLLNYHRLILPEGYSVAGEGEDAIETVSKTNRNNPDELKQYRIRFACKGQEVPISLAISAYTSDSPVDGLIRYMLEGEKNPLTVSGFIQIVSAAVSGICPEIDPDELETALAEAAYGFTREKIFKPDNITCAISGGTKENLVCSLLPPNAALSCFQNSGNGFTCGTQHNPAIHAVPGAASSR